MKLFKFSHSSGDIDFYVPNDSVKVYIKSIDKQTGTIIDKTEVIEYTVHKNVDIYEITGEYKGKNLFTEPLLVSNDHSVLVYDLETDSIKTLKPSQIHESKNYYFIFDNRDDQLFQETTEQLYKQYYYLPILRKLYQQRCVLINTVQYIKVSKIDKKGTLYDITVNPTTTLRLSNGLFIQDSMAQYFV